jgi:hypothetical protein
MGPLETAGSILAFLIYASLLYQQNRIMQQQNDIMLRQEANKKKAEVIVRPYRFYWPMIVMGLLTALAVIAVGTYISHSENDLPEDTVENAIVRNYGWKHIASPATGQAPGSCFILANGKRFYQWSDKYSLWFARVEH